MKRIMTIDLDHDQVDLLVVASLKNDYRSLAAGPLEEDDELRDAIEVVLAYYLSPEQMRDWFVEKAQFHG